MIIIFYFCFDIGKLPWNMVSGSEGRQLRLNPVSNSDTDPNCFIAQVFMIKKQHGKVLFTKLKKLIFRIEIPVIGNWKLLVSCSSQNDGYISLITKKWQDCSDCMMSNIYMSLFVRSDCSRFQRNGYLLLKESTF